MKLEGIGESELLRRILPYLTTSGYAVVAGEDDAAVWPSLDPDYPEDYVVASCDTSVEGIHFDLSWMSPADAGIAPSPWPSGPGGQRRSSEVRACCACGAAFVVGGNGDRALRRDPAAGGSFRTCHCRGDTTAIDGPAVLS